MRNYEREYQKSKEGSKTYNVRIPLYIAVLLDDKLKRERQDVRKCSKRSSWKVPEKNIKKYHFLLDYVCTYMV